MKKITLLLLIIAISIPNFISAQERKVPTKIFGQELTNDNQRSIEETGFIHCGTTEYERALQEKYPNRASTEEFENWIAPLIEARKQRIAQEKSNGTFRRVVVNIPIIFHVLTGSAGDANDIAASQIQAQIDQLNIDFGNLAGSTDPVAADAEIVFIPATIDPSGAPLTEPGIDRVYGYPGTLGTAALDGTIKPATIWDRSFYANIWVANLGGGLLGYAQFPSSSTLPGMPGGDEGALTDGVVILTGSVGSVANPGTSVPYNLGRTLTHEIGHWIGLRHIWGDGGCTVDDFCADTPNAGGANFGCPNVDSCAGGGPDMVENYMDYSDDACMNIFTNDQVGRMLVALENATGLSDLPNSTTGDPLMVFDLDGRVTINDLNLDECAFEITPVIAVVNNGNNALTSATISYGINGSSTDINWTGNLPGFGDSETINLPTMTGPTGSNTFEVEISDPNGGTDMNTVNDIASRSFNLGASFYGSSSIELELTTDNWCEETSWDFRDSSGTILYSGGPYTANAQDNTTFNESFAIVDDECYTFTIYDAYGDGICCDFGTGSYILTDNSGTVIFSGGEFSDEESTTVSTAALSTTDFEFANSLSIFPNPVNNVLTISTTDSLPENFTVYNMLGQVMISKSISNESDLTVNTSDFSNGMYFIKISKEGNSVSLPFIKK